MVGFTSMKHDNEKQEILKKVKKYCEFKFPSVNNFDENKKILYAQLVPAYEEMVNLVDCILDYNLVTGKYECEFEKSLANYLGVKYCSLVNSGSSANLLAFMSLTSDILKDKAIKRGDEVITVAAAFPTTVAPIVQYGAVPVFVDVKIPQYNIDISEMQKALTDKTKAVMIAHTLGNPFDLSAVKEFCNKNNLWLIEDNCDSLGSKYLVEGKEKYTGTFGDIGTSSFYPAHHISLAGAGAVYTDNALLNKILLSLRDWGRDCTCAAGQDNKCGHRFDKQYGLLPIGYDHKYVYSHFGYNLRATNIQAAMGVAQLKKLPHFIERRRHNFNRLKGNLNSYKNQFILPEENLDSQASWFAFLLTCVNGVNRNKTMNFLEENNIQTRTLFAGNIIKHPCFEKMREKESGFRVVGNLKNTDKIMNDSFLVGLHPNITDEMIDYISEKIIQSLNIT